MEKLDFNIAVGPANHTLGDYATQSKLIVSYDYRFTEVTHAVHGRMTKKKALSRLLSGTDLTPDFLDDQRVAILKRTPTPPQVDQIGEVTIRHDHTGTYMPDSLPVGAELISIDREQMQDEGAATVAELLQHQTQNFGGGPSQDTHFFTGETKANATFAQSGNLRALGARATLVLINGRRIAPSGSEASFFDVSNIPLSIVDHMEVLLDGASAVYGSDAVGGVINFITKDNLTGQSHQGFDAVAELGSVTEGSQLQYRTSGSWSNAWEGGNVFLGFELLHHGALSASDRPYTSSDLTRYGGPNFDTLASHPGTLIAGSTNYAIPRGRGGGALDFATLVAGAGNLSDLYRDSEILPSQDQRSFFGGLHQKVGGVVIFGTLLWTDRFANEAQGGQRLIRPVPASNPFLLNRPQDVRIAYDLGDELGTLVNDARVRVIHSTLGADLQIGQMWLWSTVVEESVENEHQRTLGAADANALDSALQTTLNLFGDGRNIDPARLAAIRVVPMYQSKSELRELYSVANGPLFMILSGSVSGAFGVDLRYQRFATEVSPPHIDSNLTRQLIAGFTEVKWTAADGPIGIRKLEISFIGRYEHYSDFGGSFTPRFAVNWTPMLGAIFYGSWGRSFRAPNPGDLDERSNVSFLQSFPDASAGAEALVVAGKNARLTPERATTGTIGVMIAPVEVSDLGASATFFDTTFKDRIQSTDFNPDILNDPTVQDIVTREPSEQDRAQICKDANNHFNGDQSTCLYSPIVAIVDLRVRNLAALHTQGFDVAAHYSLGAARGKLSLSFESTYLLDYSVINMPHDPRVSLLNTQNNPINLHLIGAAKWDWQWTWIRLGTNYANSYRDVESVPQRSIGAWLTFDLQLGFRFGSMQIVANVQNVSDRDPPFLINRTAKLAYDQENADPNGRTVKITVQKKW